MFTTFSPAQYHNKLFVSTELLSLCLLSFYDLSFIARDFSNISKVISIGSFFDFEPYICDYQTYFPTTPLTL
jgi:hypothetical protein